MRYFVYTSGDCLLEVQRNYTAADDNERRVGELSEAFPTAIYFEVAP